MIFDCYTRAGISATVFPAAVYFTAIRCYTYKLFTKTNTTTTTADYVLTTAAAATTTTTTTTTTTMTTTTQGHSDGGISVYIPPQRKNQFTLKTLCGCSSPVTQDRFDMIYVHAWDIK